MAAEKPLYDLVLLLDSAAEDDRRAEILKNVEEAVAKAGEIVNRQEWGMRSLAFEIRHKKDAEYHLLQFHGTPELLSQIDRTLRITDEVVRFRVIKLAPGTPPPPEHRAEPRPAGVVDDEAAPAPSETGEDAQFVPAEAASAEAEAPAAEAEAPAVEAEAPAAPEPVAAAVGEGEEPAPDEPAA